MLDLTTWEPAAATLGPNQWCQKMHELLSWSCINDCLDVFFFPLFFPAFNQVEVRGCYHTTLYYAHVEKSNVFEHFLSTQTSKLETKMALRVYIEQWLDDFGHLYERTWYFTRWRRVWKAEENQRYMQAMVVWRKLQSFQSTFQEGVFYFEILSVQQGV